MDIVAEYYHVLKVKTIGDGADISFITNYLYLGGGGGGVHFQ